MKRKLIIASFMAFICYAASGQTGADLLRYSTYNNSFSTARSSAMGGAFTSLGADLSTMSINPAGLGMYRSSDLSISTSLNFNRTKTDNYSGMGLFNQAQNKTSLNLNNLGVAINLDESSGGAIRDVVLGISINRVANFNSASTVKGRSLWSALDIFSDKLGVSGITGATIDEYPYSILEEVKPSLYGPILAYESLLLDWDTDNGYNLTDILSSNAIMNSYFKRKISGGVYDFNLSLGFNVEDAFYFGATFNAQSLYYREINTYSEAPEGNSGFDLKDYDYVRRLTAEGVGFNLKVGAIYKPVEPIKIGIAYHSPSWTNVTEDYSERIHADFNGFASEYAGYKAAPFEYKTIGAHKMTTGISLTLPRMILSFDYERGWYDGMKLKDVEGWEYSDVSDEVAGSFKANNVYRAGAEFRVVDDLYLRGGYAYYDSPYKESFRFGHQNASLSNYGQTENISAGLGYRTSKFYVDFAYVNMKTKLAPYHIFNYLTSYNEPITIGEVYPEENRNSFIFTVGVRF